MHAKALICDENQNFSYADITLPDPGPEHLLIRALYSGVSIGTEFALIRNKISGQQYPLCTGYQGVGVVEHVGEKVDAFKVGDKVYYRDNREGMQLPDGTKVSAAAGVHCSAAVIRPQTTHGLELLPEGVPNDAASLFVMPAVGLNGVDTANPRMGDVVAVYGAGLVGLGVIAACSHRGCVVVAVDLEQNRLEVARKLGADYLINGTTQNVVEELQKITPDGADVVFESTGVPACIDPAIELCRRHGKFVLQGHYRYCPALLSICTAPRQTVDDVLPV